MTEKRFAGEETIIYPDDPKRRQAHVFSTDDEAAILSALDAERPLLVRGEPGVGKTQLAQAAAVKLERAFVSYAVDALTEPRDLRWWEDAVERLAKAQVSSIEQTGKSPDEIMAEVSRENFIRPGPLWWAYSWEKAKARAGSEGPEQPHRDCSSKNGVVVLIDEIDKADPAVPNGLLEALGSRSFTPPTPNAETLTPEIWPLVIVTSNDERRLPDAFLRRCVVYDMEVPEDLVSWLVDRGRLHFPEDQYPQATPEVLRLVADQVGRDRKDLAGKRPLPGQAEYLDLLRALFGRGDQSSTGIRDRLESIGKFFLKKHGNQNLSS